MATPIIMPRQGQSVESCILTEWKVKVGDEVSEGDVLAVIETDKASFDLESTASGTILELFGKRTTACPFWPTCGRWQRRRRRQRVSPSGLGSSAAESEYNSVTGPGPVSPVEVQPRPHRLLLRKPVTCIRELGVSPRARKLASSQGVDAETIVGSGPGGRVIERGVEAFLAGRPRLSVSARSKAVDGLEPPKRGSGLAGMALAGDMKVPGAIEGARIESVKGIRKVIAERMMQSLQSTAQLTLHSSFELTAAQAYRKQRLADGKSKVSLNDLIAHAIIETLKAHPEMNAHFLGDRIAVFEKVHLGVAVDTPRGLLVPVVRDSSDLSIENLSSAIKKLAGDCRERNDFSG